MLPKAGFDKQETDLHVHAPLWTGSRRYTYTVVYCRDLGPRTSYCSAGITLGVLRACLVFLSIVWFAQISKIVTFSQLSECTIREPETPLSSANFAVRPQKFNWDVPGVCRQGPEMRCLHLILATTTHTETLKLKQLWDALWCMLYWQEIINCMYNLSKLPATSCPSLPSKRDKKSIKPYWFKSFSHYLGTVPCELSRHLFDLSQIHEGVEHMTSPGSEVDIACLTVDIRGMWDCG